MQSNVLVHYLWHWARQPPERQKYSFGVRQSRAGTARLRARRHLAGPLQAVHGASRSLAAHVAVHVLGVHADNASRRDAPAPSTSATASPRGTSRTSASSPSRGPDDPTTTPLVEGGNAHVVRKQLGHEHIVHFGVAFGEQPSRFLTSTAPACSPRARGRQGQGCGEPAAGRTRRRRWRSPVAAGRCQLPRGRRALRGPRPGARRPGASARAERRAGFSGLRSLRSLRPENPPPVAET